MNYEVKNFGIGTITRSEIGAESLPKGAAGVGTYNWLSRGDGIELRRGKQLVGINVAGNDRVTGLFTGKRFDGTEVAFYSYLRKVKSIVDGDADWTEISSNLLPTAASAEDICFGDKKSLAGAFCLFSSPNSSIYEVPYANPTSLVDLSSTNHKGKFRIVSNAMYLWDRKDSNGGSDKTGLYRSYIDKDELSDYTQVTAEAIGASGATTYTGTLAFKTGQPKRTCMYPVFQATVAAGTETFQDNRDGVLTSNLGGTGTINYATGVYSVTFSDVTTGAVTADYYWENATSTGIADFSKATPRVAGQGFVLRQDDAGGIQNVPVIAGTIYPMSKYKTYKVSLADDDSTATNKVYRDQVGISYFRNMTETGEGVYYIDDRDINDARFRLLEFAYGTTELIPRDIAPMLDLSPYRFDQGGVYEFGTYIIIIGRQESSDNNDRMFIMDRSMQKLTKNYAWDILDYRASCCDKFTGKLIAGDSASPNVFYLFNSFSDEAGAIPNAWISGNSNLDFAGYKTANRLYMSGLIATDQSIKVYISVDNGAFVEVFTVEGSGSYVNINDPHIIGASMIGEGTIGGEGDEVTAYSFAVEFPITTINKGERFKIKFVAQGIGYCKISEYTYKDIRRKGRGTSPQLISG